MLSGILPLLITAGLLVLPGLALRQHGVDLRWAGGYAFAIGVATYWAYARDKRSAEQGYWRIQEANLHLLELLGGWPGAFLAQRRLRHKCSKRSYQVVFWLIVLAFQFVALDALLHWKLSQAAFGRLLGH